MADTASNTSPDLAPSAAPRLDPAIFREYDIRGTVGKNLNTDVAYHVGCAFGTFCRAQGLNNIALGYDGRLSSPMLARAVQEGLQRAGCNIILTGLGPSPMLYFAVKHIPADAGIMITGSHNPADMNGFKMLTRNGPVFGADIAQLHRIMQSGAYTSGRATHHEYAIKPFYIDRLIQDCRLDKFPPLNVAWDAGNGAAAAILPELAQRMPGQHLLMYADVDGRFPNHHPDPTVDANLVDLIDAVKTNQCDLGIAFDGDGDRIGVVDEKGGVIRCDMLLALYAREVLSRHPGAPIIGDIKCSSVLFDEIARMGGQPVMWKTGHSLIKSKMAELNAPLAGELSGHIFFADGYYGFDDGLYCAIRLLNLLAESGQKLSEQFAHLPRLFDTPELRFDIADDVKFQAVEALQQHVQAQAANHADVRVSTLDGVRVETPDGWWLVRASNTQAAVVARCEATSAEGLAKLKSAVMSAGEAAGLTIDFDAKGSH